MLHQLHCEQIDHPSLVMSKSEKLPCNNDYGNIYFFYHENIKQMKAMSHEGRKCHSLLPVFGIKAAAISI